MAVINPTPEVSMFDGMRRLLSGVSVVTASNLRGERFAMTATSITSVSAEPPSLLVCVNRSARIDHAIKESAYFCINILAPMHKQISINCSTPEASVDSRFDHGNWHLDEATGVYYLADAQATFFCRRQATHHYGTHNIFIGDVIRTEVDPGNVTVLGYLNGGYVVL